jgi:hypothetical protein
MHIALAIKKLASSSGATYQRGYAAPLGLRRLFVSEHLYTYRPSGADPQNPTGSANRKSWLKSTESNHNKAVECTAVRYPRCQLFQASAHFNPSYSLFASSKTGRNLLCPRMQKVFA